MKRRDLIKALGVGMCAAGCPELMALSSDFAGSIPAADHKGGDDSAAMDVAGDEPASALNGKEQRVSPYNIVWNSPSKDSLDSMPLSGRLGAGANVWVQDGSLWLYLAHNGAYDENGRLLKLGCVRVTSIAFQNISSSR